MTKRGGGSHRRRFSILVVSILLFTASFYPSIAAYAEEATPSTPLQNTPQEQAPMPELRTFSRSQAYRERVTAIALYTAPDAHAVDFYVGEEKLPSERIVPDGETRYVLWRPTVAPQTAGQPLRAEVDGVIVPDQAVELHELPIVSLRPYDVPQSGVTLTVHGSVSETLETTQVHLRLLSAAGVLHEQDVLVRGADVDLAELSLADIAPGNYTVELTAIDSIFGDIGAATQAFTVPGQSAGDVLEVGKPTLYVDKLNVEPIGLLSTEFSVPVSSSLTEAITGSNAPVSDQDTAAAIGGEANTLAVLHAASVDQADALHDLPVTPTRGGWAAFGVAWYWWGSAVAASWLVVVAVRWWLR